MSDLIERIIADREAGTPGDWEVPDQTWSRSLTVNTAGGLDCTMIPCSGSGGAMSYTDEVCALSWTTGDEWLSNARRIARVPEMESRILADAEALKAADEMERLLKRYRTETPLGHQPHMIDEDVDNALTAYRKARGGEA